jgi:pyrimidine operon attenuation protein / uracil phosphoribosyltransferase
MTRPLDAEAIYRDLFRQVSARLSAESRMPAIIGIHSGGAWIAERLHAELRSDAPLGYLSSAFHRDDYAERGLRASGPAKNTQIGFDVDGADILLVDDILYTGRTVRAALNEIYDYGRPRRVQLAALLDRGGRELPVQPDFLGAAIALEPGQQFALERTDDGHLRLAVEQD